MLQSRSLYALHLATYVHHGLAMGCHLFSITSDTKQLAIFVPALAAHKYQ